MTGWQAGAGGGFCSLPLRWLTGGGVSLRLSWMKSNMWTSRTHSCASVAHSRNDTVDPEAVWPLVMKSLLFSVADVGPFVHETIVFYDLLWPLSPALLIPSSHWQCWNTTHCSLAYFRYTVNTCSLWLIQWPTATLNQSFLQAQDNVSNIVHLSGWANGRCNISHALHGIFDTTTIVSCYQYRAQYTWYL